jgi:hypothetical protein
VNPSGESRRESHPVSGTAVREERESADGDRAGEPNLRRASTTAIADETQTHLSMPSPASLTSTGATRQGRVAHF